ncbi:hypothetical protein EWM64_g7879, partial [Hericium alpestre]
KEKAGGEDGESGRLEERMRRAMGDAEGESAGSEVDGDFDMGEGEGEDEDGEESDEVVGEEESELNTEDEAMLTAGQYERDEDEDGFAEALPDPKSKYLPDHLFTAALSKKKPTISPAPSAAPKRRKRVQKTAKDIVIGSRIIRALPHIDGLDTLSAPGTATPPARTNRFLSRALTKKGTSKKGAGWERRPANVGVLRRIAGAPAAGFVRQR